MTMNPLKLHPGCWRALVALAFLLPFAAASEARADRVVNANEPVVISNDITNRTTGVRSAESGVADEDDAEAPAVPASPSGDDAVASPAPGNHGHGNNEDGVDSSNPGQGKGGPNGGVDESCDGSGACVDDESTGGGSSKGNKK
jgi:hypothetical protein